MTTELQFLAASIILGLVHLIADSHLISFQYGYRWTGSTREAPVPPLRGVANRVDQAYTNFMETFPFFAAVVLAAHLTGRESAWTLWGAHLYFWGRLGYALAAAAGYSLLRSVVFFNTAGCQRGSRAFAEKGCDHRQTEQAHAADPREASD